MKVTRTANRLKEIANEARRDQKRVVCFVTGEPGSGKTLLGLDLVFSGNAGRVAEEPAALLSGNRPQVFVLKQTLTELRFPAIQLLRSRHRHDYGVKTTGTDSASAQQLLDPCRFVRIDGQPTL